MFNRSVSFRFIVIGLAILAVGALSAAANWGGGLSRLIFFGPTGAASKVEASSKPTAFLVPTVKTVCDTGSPDLSSVAAAVADANTNFPTGNVTYNVCAGLVETAPAGGYVITASGSAGNEIIFQKSGAGANPTLTASAALASGALNDGIFKIVGGDYITIDGFTMLENAANTTTTAASNNMTEFGIALFYATPTDNSQNVTLKNNTITLNRTYQNTFGIYANATHTAAAVTTSATGTGPTGGNSGLKVYGNTISNVNQGIVVVGPTAAADQNDGIDIGGASGATGNIISNYGTTGTFSGYANVSGTVYGILVRNSKNYNISYNNITSSSGATGVTAGTLRGIYVPSASNQPTGTFTNNVNNNTLSVTSNVVAGTINGISVESTTSSPTSTTNINNNNFTALNHSVAAASGAVTGIIQAGSATAGPLVTSVSNNTFTNIVTSTTGSFTFISNNFTNPANATKNVNGNSIVTGFSKTGAGGTVTLFTDNGSDTAGSINNSNNNDFQNITVTGATTIAGWLNTNGGAPTKTVTGNTFAHWTGGTSAVTALTVSFSGSSNVSNNGVTFISSGGAITGITSSSGTLENFSNNTIHTLSSSGASAVVGMSNTGGTTKNFFRNKIYDLSTSNAGGSVNGMLVSSGTTVNIWNNLVGDLRGPALNAANSLIGINITGGTTVSADFNSVWVAGSSSGALFGSSALSASTSPALTLRNNVLVNNSSVTGVGLAAAYRRSSTTLTTYQAASNNNDFYGSTIFTDGTNTDTTLASYKARVASRDSSSISENPPFLGTDGTQPSFLHINPVTPTQLESGGIPVSGITADFDGDTRNVASPDIGADEFTGVLLDLTGPTVSYTALLGTSSTTDRFLNVTVTDASGVPTSGVGLPVIYYRKNVGSYVASQCAFSGGSQYSCPIVVAALGGVVTGDVVGYYVAAQDTIGNVSVTPSAGSGGYTANPPAASTPPTTPSQYNIVPPISGSFNVGTGETYTSLTNAGGIFEAINNSEVTGNITINITSDLSGELGTNGISAFAAPYTITISPSGGPRSITGSTSANAMIRTEGASRVTIDGSVGGAGTDRSLTIENTSATTPQVVRFGSSGTTAIVGNTLKNCVIRNGVNTSSAVVVTDTTGVAGYFNNITIQNNDIQKAYVGIFTNAAVLAGNGSGLLITQNKMDTSGANSLRNVGAYVQGADGATVSNNIIGNFDNTAAENDTGIWLATGAVNTTVSGNSVTALGYSGTSGNAPYGIRDSGGAAASGNNLVGNTVSNISTNGSTQVFGIEDSSGGTIIQRNNVQGIVNANTGTFGAYGIDVSAGNNVVLKNNFVSNVTGDMTGGAAFSTTFGIFGIRIGAGTGHQIYHNSVNLYGARAGTATTSLLTAAFAVVGTTSTGMDVRNNIFANNITGGTTSIANVSAYLPSGGTSAMNLTWNNNSYYFGADATRQGAGQAGTTAGTNFFTTLPLMAAYTSGLSPASTNDNASISSTGAVPFLSANDLHIPLGSAEVDAGAVLASVLVDIDGDPRPYGAGYDIGADEQPDVTPPDTQILTNPTNPSNSSDATFTFSGTDSVISAVASFECDLDGSGFATCTSPKTYNGLSQGSHTFQVRAKDGAGNVDPTPASYTWTVDTIAPDTQILTTPPNPSNTSSPTFTFSGSDSAIATVASFECSVDADPFTPCTSPATPTGLLDGTRLFRVRAIDAAGNVDPTPASYTWVIDTVAPDTSILTHPTDPSSSADASFTFTGSGLFGTPALSFECKLDAAAFSACSSPQNYTMLADGSHTFQVRAVDLAGNIDPTPASFTWTISTSYTGPVTVTATAGTAGPTDYPTVKDAFDAINAGTHQGDIVVNVVTNTTESASAVLNSSGAGSASYTSVVIRPYNDGVTVAGATLQGRGLIELNGADNVTMNGDNPNTAGVNRNLTLRNTAANTVTFTSVVRIALATTIVTSADNDTIKNLNIVGSATGRNNSAATSTTGSENTTFGIIAGPGASTVSATTAPSAITSVSTSVGTGATANNLLISNNSIVTAARGVSVNGSATTVFPGVQISANDIGNPTAGAADQVTSIGITAQGSSNGFIAANNVWVEGYVPSSAATHGINVGVNSATGTFTIDSNRVNRVKNSNGGSWSAFGINLGGGSNHVVQNNFVSGVINDQTAGTGAFSTTFGAFGIRVASGTGHKIYQNSVNLYGVMGGVTSTDLTAAFGITSATLTGVDVRNNIFANRITAGNPTGTRHVAVYLPSGATVSMNLTDNNNAYFSGTDANDRLAQTGTTFGAGEYLAANFDPSATTPATNFRAYTSPLSAAGTNDNASFVKTTPPPFATASDLHIPNSTVTQLESGGAAVGVTVDIDGDTRPNGTAPDIGADEFTGVLPPANDIAANSFIVPTDGGVLPAGTSGQPQASFTNVGLSAQTNVSVQFAANGPMGYTFTDTQVIPTINPGSTVTVTFATAPTLVAGSYTMSAAVITTDSNSANDLINGSFTAVPPVSGTVTVGGGGNFASLTNPGGLFDTINTLGTSGPVVANISADLTGETGAVALNEFGSSLTIKPSGGPRTISGNGSALGMIRLFGADNVTIDGSLSGGTDRSLTLTYGNTGGTVIWIGAASGSNGANGTTIKNCVISGNTGTTIIAGILAGSGTTLGGAAESPNNDTTIQNNWIYRVQNGIYDQGAVAFDNNWNVTGNTFGSTVAADKNSFRGMLIGNAANFTINGNTVSGIQSTAATTSAMSGIQLAFTVNGGFVVNNTIRDIKNVSASGTGAFGMQISSTSSVANVTIANNIVSDITGVGSATATSNGYGINFNGTGAGGYKVYHNSVNMNTNQASGTTAAMLVTSAVTAAGALDVRDNIFANTQTTGATRYGVYSTAAASVFSSINYNDYFAQNVGFISGSTQVSLANWQAATAQDANSFAVDPMFVSSTDLHLALGSPMIDQAFTLPAVTTDIDGQTRPIGAANDVGADEWIAAVTISGRLTTPGGQGIKNVHVILSGGGLPQPLVAISGPFGYYSFESVPTGATYTISLSSKRFVFNPNSRLITPYTDVTSADFVSDPPTFAP